MRILSFNYSLAETGGAELLAVEQARYFRERNPFRSFQRGCPRILFQSSGGYSGKFMLSGQI